MAVLCSRTFQALATFLVMVAVRSAMFQVEAVDCDTARRTAQVEDCEVLAVALTSHPLSAVPVACARVFQALEVD